jgi:hypothetical protein
VKIPIQGRSFAYWNVPSHDWQVEHGAVQLMVGASSRDIRLHEQFNLP